MKLLALLLCLSCLVQIGGGAALHENTIIPPMGTLEKEWTFMLYDDADFDDAWDPLSNFTTEVYAGEKIHIIVLQDTEDGPAIIWEINEQHEMILVDELGEVNMGDSETLKEFIDYSKSHCPARRYLMDLYNHGAAWKGACRDDTSDGDLLTMDEIQQALDESGGIDIIMFNAPCLMGSLESVYELRNQVDVYIGSEELCGYKLGLAQQICDLLHTNSSLDTYDIGERIIDFFDDLPGDWAQKRTMIAARTDRCEQLKNTINTLCLDLMIRWFRSYKIIDAARSDTFELGEYADVKERYRVFDFYGFTEHLLTQNNIGQRMQQDIEDVQTAYDAMIINEFHGTMKPKVHGLSIYFPDSLMDGQYQQYRDRSYGLDFSKDTLWDEFLGFYIITSQLLS